MITKGRAGEFGRSKHSVSTQASKSPRRWSSEAVWCNICFLRKKSVCFHFCWCLRADIQAFCDWIGLNLTTSSTHPRTTPIESFPPLLPFILLGKVLGSKESLTSLSLVFLKYEAWFYKLPLQRYCAHVIVTILARYLVLTGVPAQRSVTHFPCPISFSAVLPVTFLHSWWLVWYNFNTNFNLTIGKLLQVTIPFGADVQWLGWRYNVGGSIREAAMSDYGRLGWPVSIGDNVVAEIYWQVKVGPFPCRLIFEVSYLTKVNVIAPACWSHSAFLWRDSYRGRNDFQPQPQMFDGQVTLPKGSTCSCTHRKTSTCITIASIGYYRGDLASCNDRVLLEFCCSPTNSSCLWGLPRNVRNSARFSQKWNVSLSAIEGGKLHGSRTLSCLVPFGWFFCQILSAPFPIRKEKNTGHLSQLANFQCNCPLVCSQIFASLSLVAEWDRHSSNKSPETVPNTRNDKPPSTVLQWGVGLAEFHVSFHWNEQSTPLHGCVEFMFFCTVNKWLSNVCGECSVRRLTLEIS